MHQFNTVSRIRKWLVTVLPPEYQFDVYKLTSSLHILWAEDNTLHHWQLNWTWNNGLYSLNAKIMEQLPLLIKHNALVGTKQFKCRCGATHKELKKDECIIEWPNRYGNTSKTRLNGYICQKCREQYWWRYVPFKTPNIKG